jgi:hypothetical protein
MCFADDCATRSLLSLRLNSAEAGGGGGGRHPPCTGVAGGNGSEGGTHTLEMGNGEMAPYTPYLYIRGFFERKWLNGVVASVYGDSFWGDTPSTNPWSHFQPGV